VLGEALLGLQQPMHHQQLAHQLLEGLAAGLPVRIAGRLDQQRMRFDVILRGQMKGQGRLVDVRRTERTAADSSSDSNTGGSRQPCTADGAQRTQVTDGYERP
jgi:hypothetical protein